jgi:hypothetical protein
MAKFSLTDISGVFYLLPEKEGTTQSLHFSLPKKSIDDDIFAY